MRAIAAIMAFLLGAAGADAQTQSDFYKGRTVTLVTGTAGNGNYDLIARVVAEFLPRYLAGSPSVIVQSMPGASHVRATEYINNIAPKDGTILGFVQPYVVLNKMLTPNARYHPEELTWIARLVPLNQFGFMWHKAGVANIEQARQKQTSFGAAGATGPSAMTAWTLNRMIGTKFRVVRGYADDADQFLAIERGELEGMGSTQLGPIARRAGWLENKWAIPIYAISLQRLKAFPETPSIVELAVKEQDREVMRILGTMPAIGITIVAPPGLASERSAQLREAVAAMTKDAAFRPAVERLAMELDPLDGPQVAAMVSGLMKTPSSTIEALAAYVAPQD